MTFDETRRAAARAYFNGQHTLVAGGNIPKDVLTRAASKLKHDAACTFDNEVRRTGWVEVHGKRIRFAVRDGRLVITATDEAETPAQVARLDAAARLIDKEREAELAINTERHERRWKV